MDAFDIKKIFKDLACLTLLSLTARNHSNAQQGLVLTHSVADPRQGNVSEQIQKVILRLGNKQRDGSSPFQQQTDSFSNAGRVEFVDKLQQCVVKAFLAGIIGNIFLVTIF